MKKLTVIKTLPAIFCFIASVHLFAQPLIRAVTPGGSTPGATIKIKGKKFDATASKNIVYFGAVRATVTAASDSLLLVSAPFGASYEPVTVTTKRLTAFSPIPFVITFPSNNIIDTATLSGRRDYLASLNPRKMAIADFNGDNEPDIAVSNQSGNSFSVFRNTSSNENIRLGTKKDFVAGNGAFDIASGDFDGDGKMDVVVSNFNSGGSSTISVFKNISSKSNILFDAKIDYPSGSGSTGVAVQDLDGDGKPDIVSANGNSGNILVFKNISTPGAIDFASGISYAVNYAQSVAIGDLDGDGKPDIAAAEFSGIIAIFKNISTKGNISFSGGLTYSAAQNPVDIKMGDLNSDGKLDLVVTNFSSNEISILKNTSNTGSIIFEPAINFSTGANPQYASISDIDGDGKPDVAVASNTDNNACVLKNVSANGNILFAQKINYAAAFNPTSVKLQDMNGDAKPDLIICNSTSGSLTVLKNNIPDALVADKKIAPKTKTIIRSPIPIVNN